MPLTPLLGNARVPIAYGDRPSDALVGFRPLALRIRNMTATERIIGNLRDFVKDD